MAQKKLKNRNPVARNLYQNKGGVHEKSKKSKRAQAKRETCKEVSKWRLRSSLFFRQILTINHK